MLGAQFAKSAFYYRGSKPFPICILSLQYLPEISQGLHKIGCRDEVQKKQSSSELFVELDPAPFLFLAIGLHVFQSVSLSPASKI